jgi:saccharopine dehydrogenase-like NADP-dependent oxidoreductase
MNAGLAPGVTNLVAAERLRAHPEADDLEIVFTLSSATARGPASVDVIVTA